MNHQNITGIFNHSSQGPNVTSSAPSSDRRTNPRAVWRSERICGLERTVGVPIRETLCHFFCDSRHRSIRRIDKRSQTRQTGSFPRRSLMIGENRKHDWLSRKTLNRVFKFEGKGLAAAGAICILRLLGELIMMLRDSHGAIDLLSFTFGFQLQCCVLPLLGFECFISACLLRQWVTRRRFPAWASSSRTQFRRSCLHCLLSPSIVRSPTTLRSNPPRRFLAA